VLATLLSLLVTACTACAMEMPDSDTVGPTPDTTAEQLTLTIVYDNNAYDARLQTDWGFACLIETGQSTILFDTGGKGAILIDNMAALGIDPQAIDAVVLSHAHGDHTGGLQDLLNAGARPVVYALASFSLAFKNEVRAQTELVEVKAPTEIAPGVYTTGRVGSQIPEQALVIKHTDGPVIVTGCAHPGIVEMVRRARQTVDQDPTLVVGGFHLGQASAGQIETIIADLGQLGVRQVAPCHCTGNRARRMFAAAYGPDCVLAGVGQVIER
jgi:7,8-dihydropterin-6-yl-methyl-4-(beta-D-ribofuranosyl)aminobenzene 5'-phosphate synthase